MSPYTLAWHDDTDPTRPATATVGTVGELDIALNLLTELAAAHGLPRLVDLYRDTGTAGQAVVSYGFRMVWGHPERVALTWLGNVPAHLGDWALPNWPEPIEYDQGVIPPWRTRLTVHQARQALHEYVETGKRPACGYYAQFLFPTNPLQEKPSANVQPSPRTASDRGNTRQRAAVAGTEGKRSRRG